MALQPALSTVAPGALLEVDLVIAAAGDSFNAYEAVIGFDPAALTFVGMSPISLQEGSLMSAACANRSNIFHSSPDSLRISHSLLCSNTLVAGPGTIYKLQFLASNTPQTTHVVFRRHSGPPTAQGLQFYKAGIAVSAVYSSEAQVAIGVAAGAGAGPGSGGLSIRAYPNPSRGAAQFLVRGASFGSPAMVQVTDPSGRIRRTFFLPKSGAAPLCWDGRDEAGTRVAAGHYFVSVRCGQARAHTRLVLAP